MSKDEKHGLSQIFTFQTKAKLDHLKKLKDGKNAIQKGVLKATESTKTTLFRDFIAKDELPEAIQQAVGIEIATIPTYLYTYYSIIRTFDADQASEIEAKILEAVLKEETNPKKAKAKAQKLTVDIQVFANKSAAIIMSVVVEEMLHMALSSNVMQALVGPPLLYKQSPEFPAALPGHIPEFGIHLAPFSQDQLITFMRIESPLPFIDKSAEKAKGKDVLPYSTIGQFYCMVENCIRNFYQDDSLYNKERPQLMPNKGVYTSNTINTVYYNELHEPQFPNSNSKGDLIKVENLWTALASMQEIVEQGEGASGGNHLDKYGMPIEGINYRDIEKNPKDKDGEGDGEISHFDKFLSLYYQHEELSKEIDKLKMTQGNKPYTLDSIILRPLPIDPKTAQYPADIAAASILTNAVYAYTFIMIEDCYFKPEDTQYEIFMYGIHKTMIWILSELCHAMSNMTYTDEKGNIHHVGTTFELYEFKEGISPKAQLIALANNELLLTKEVSMGWVLALIEDLPDVKIHKRTK